MGEISPVITKETTVWRCWVGFNASHSMGLMLYGLISIPFVGAGISLACYVASIIVSLA